MLWLLFSCVSSRSPGIPSTRIFPLRASSRSGAYTFCRFPLTASSTVTRSTVWRIWAGFSCKMPPIFSCSFLSFWLLFFFLKNGGAFEQLPSIVFVSASSLSAPNFCWIFWLMPAVSLKLMTSGPIRWVGCWLTCSIGSGTVSISRRNKMNDYSDFSENSAKTIDCFHIIL